AATGEPPQPERSPTVRARSANAEPPRRISVRIEVPSAVAAAAVTCVVDSVINALPLKSVPASHDDVTRTTPRYRTVDTPVSRACARQRQGSDPHWSGRERSRPQARSDLLSSGLRPR